MNSGTLYIVATPIGNLEDISFRAVRILKEVALIAAEDTRKTKRLLSHYGIETPLTSYHEHNEMKKSEELVRQLQNGKDIALVSEAGTPTISDPGYRLILAATEAGLKLVPIPGASAVATSLSISGLPTDRFLFVGFLPDKVGKRRKKIEEISEESATLVFYISKWKLGKVLSDLNDLLGNRRVCFCRELTKLHEEIRYEMLADVANNYSDVSVKGEITLVVEGKKG
jgi:16S rRNA (cytidine1402-2'-O)-methyltransferase